MALQKHLDSQYKAILRNNQSDLPKIIQSAFKKRILTLSYRNPNSECLLLEIFLNETLKSVQLEVISFLKINFAFKFNIELHAIYAKPNVKELDINWIQPKIFKTEMQEIFYTEDFAKEFLLQVKNLKRKTEEFQAKEGGWTLLQLVKVDFKLAKYQPLRGAGFIPLPKSLKLKQACVNVQNKDVFCFKWAVISAVSRVSHLNRPASYKVDIESEIIQTNDFTLNFAGLKFPLQIKDVSIFIKNNPSISINVFGYNENNDSVIGPYYKTKEEKPNHINLLYIEDGKKKNAAGHYVWIKNLSRLIGRQLTLSSTKIKVCNTCLQHFSKDNYEKHFSNCGQNLENVLYHDKCALKFKNSVKVVDVPFVIYAKSKSFAQDNKTASPLKYIYMYFIKCNYDDNLSKWHIFKGPNAHRQFAESLIEDAKFYYDNYSRVIKPKLPLTDEENLEYQEKYNCCLCLKDIPQDIKVKLHCRLTGKYKGPAHHTCAFNYRIPKKFPVIFQNLSFDDSVLLIKQLSDIDDDSINVRTANNELYISLQKDIKIEPGILELRFLNFAMFLSCGLESSVEDMAVTDFKNLKSTYPDVNTFDMIFTKIIFPYKYLTSFEQLEENCLPSIDKFYDVRINKECSLEDYENALKLWSEFKCKTLEDYLTVCLKIDILILTDAFENFRSVCRDAYNMDPCHYYNAAEFSWDAMLKITDINLTIPPEKEMHVFLEKGIRAGISKCFQRYSMANNKYLSDYDNKLPSKYLMSFHANDVYGRVMTERLPEGNFEWETDIINFSLNSIPNDSDVGYILEVDLEYPSNVFESHKTLRFCSENIGFLKNMEGIFHKTNYVIYYKNLQQCLKHGLKLKKIHRILKFKQSDWMKKYIMFNKTPSDNTKSFRSNVLKLMNTAIYEKIMEKSVKKMKITDKWESDGRKAGARNLIVRDGFSSIIIIDEELLGLELYTNTFKKAPVNLEFIISELVKLKMYDFHYEYIMPKYKTNVQLNYIDTDSFIYTITTGDLYKDIKNDILSMINPTDCYNFRLLLKTLGIMKDANDGVVLKQFIGFRSKLYALKTETIPSHNILNSTSLSNYTNLLSNNEVYFDSIHSFKLKLYHRYVTLFYKELPLSYLDKNNVLSNETVNKLSCFYYPKSVVGNNCDEELMDFNY